MGIHPGVVRDFKDKLDKVFVGLMGSMLSIWEMRKDFTHPEKMIDIDNLTNFDDIMEALRTIDEAVRRGRPVVDPFQLWNVIMLVRRVVLDVDFMSNHFKALKDPQADLPDEFKEIVSQGLETQDKFLAASNQILGALDTKIIPFQEVLKIICGGSLNQNCHFCEEEIVIAHANVVGRSPAVFVGLFTTGIYCCGTGECIVKALALEKDWKQFTCAVGSTFMERNEIVCDFCFQLPPKSDVHRCSGCLTVMYCSKTCYDRDWKIHKIFCKKEVEDRKVKCGGSARRKAAREGVEALGKGVINDVVKEVVGKFKIKNAKKNSQK